MQTPERTAYESAYEDRFERYTRRTDGKAIVGEAMAQIIAADGHKSALDIGAGNGVLADRFRGAFDHLKILVSERKNMRRVLRDDWTRRTAQLRDCDQPFYVDYLINGRHPFSQGHSLCSGDSIEPVFVMAELDRLIVLEEKQALADKLGRFSFDQLIHARAEDVDYSRLDFDCAYMSYAINGIANAALPRVLRNLFGRAGHAPSLYIVTDGDFSPWGETAQRIAAHLGIEWTGGSGRDMERVVLGGGQARLICDLETHIYAPTIEELKDTLSAFFVRARQAYDTQHEEICRIVEDHSINADIDGQMQRVMQVSEQIFDVMPA